MRAVGRLAAGAARYLDEVSGQAEFRRVCRAHAAGAPGGRLSARERRRLWRVHTAKGATTTARCC